MTRPDEIVLSYQWDNVSLDLVCYIISLCIHCLCSPHTIHHLQCIQYKHTGCLYGLEFILIRKKKKKINLLNVSQAQFLI